MQLGLVGLGKMGFNMRARLREGGHEVVGYDPRPEVSDVASLAELAVLPELKWHKRQRKAAEKKQELEGKDVHDEADKSEPKKHKHQHGAPEVEVAESGSEEEDDAESDDEGSDEDVLLLPPPRVRPKKRASVQPGSISAATRKPQKKARFRQPPKSTESDDETMELSSSSSSSSSDEE